MSIVQNFRLNGMSDVTCRKRGRLRVQGRGSHVALFREDPTPMMNGSLRDCHTSYFIHFAINPIA